MDLLAHVHPGGGVLFLLLDALALDEVDSVDKSDGAARSPGSAELQPSTEPEKREQKAKSRRAVHKLQEGRHPFGFQARLPRFIF